MDVVTSKLTSSSSTIEDDHNNNNHKKNPSSSSSSSSTTTMTTTTMMTNTNQTTKEKTQTQTATTSKQKEKRFTLPSSKHHRKIIVHSKLSQHDDDDDDGDDDDNNDNHNHDDIFNDEPIKKKKETDTTSTKTNNADNTNISIISNATYLYAFCAALNSCNLGYDIGVSTNVGPLIQQDWNWTNPQLELFLGSINFWSIFGAAIISPIICDAYGRKMTFRIAAIGFILGILIMITSPSPSESEASAEAEVESQQEQEEEQSSFSSYSFLQIMIGRMIVGLAVGAGEAIDPMYISEMVPPTIRGELVSWAEAGVAVGVVLGFTSSWIFLPLQQTIGLQWRCMLALGMVLPIVMLVLLSTIMPESPRWLITKKRYEEAKYVLKQIYIENDNEDDDDDNNNDDKNGNSNNSNNHSIVQSVFQDIQNSLAMEQRAAQAVGWSAIICHPTPAIRRMVLVGCGISIIQQAVGIDAIMFYLIYVIRQAGVTTQSGQFTALITLGMVKLIFVFVGAKCMDTQGRRPLLFLSLGGCALSLCVVSWTIAQEEALQRLGNDDIDNGLDTSSSSSSSSWTQIMTIIALGVYLAFFSIGIGPGNWVVVSEVFATSIRAKGMSLAIFPNRVTATIMASSFLSIAQAITWPGFFLLLASICAMSGIFLYIYLPETKNKSLEEMSLYFAQITGDRSILDVEEELVSVVVVSSSESSSVPNNNNNNNYDDDDDKDEEQQLQRRDSKEEHHQDETRNDYNHDHEDDSHTGGQLELSTISNTTGTMV